MEIEWLTHFKPYLQEPLMAYSYEEIVSFNPSSHCLMIVVSRSHSARTSLFMMQSYTRRQVRVPNHTGAADFGPDDTLL